MQFNTLQIQEIIIHQVPSRTETSAIGPKMSQASSPNDATVFAFFRKKLTGVMGSKSLFIEQNPLTIGDLALETVISAVKKINNDAQTFVVESQKIAQRLWDTQDRRNPAGLLVVARGQIEARPCVGILKLEHEHGVQAEESSDDHGNFVYKIILHDDLMLTDHTAVFKGVVFGKINLEEEDLVAKASDLQNVREVAGYFLNRFLGCRFVDDPQEMTRKYFDEAERFVQSFVEDPEKCARYEGALLANVNSNSGSINPLIFANDNLEPEDCQSFLNHLEEVGVPVAPFPKDLNRISRRVRRVAYSYKSGLNLVGTPEAMAEHVAVESGENQNSTVTTIRDELKVVRGRG